VEEENINSEKEKNEEQPKAKTDVLGKEEIKKIPTTVWNYIISIFSFKQDKEVNALEVIDNIKKDIEFKGASVWILICSIIIASIGLNLNSVAVIIGAMLISPLMGPIKGIGLAVGTNNVKLLLFSLSNFAVATVVSLIASFIYFKITPFKDANHEILDRTETIILAVFIAFFGGLAGIISSVRNERSTVVPGVAIATALMPPLCVAGYGLANNNFNYFLGASYLFLLNAVFICLTTILVVRYLKFPLATYINKKRERKIKIYFFAFLLVILIPSGIKFYSVIKKTIFINTSIQFIEKEINPITGVNVYKNNVTCDDRTLTLYLGGSGRIDDIRKEELERIMNTEYGLENAKLLIIQSQADINRDNLTMEDYTNLISNYNKLIDQKDKELETLSKRLNTNEGKKFDLVKAEKRLKFENDFKQLFSFSAANAYEIKMSNVVDTTLLFKATWNDTMLNPTRTKRLKQWIEIEFDCTDFELVETLKK
jgi:uncharacterized hydrophobic protein (TIGR00271 family)